MMNYRKILMPIGIFGGTFDPVHLGHLRTAIEIREKFFLQDVYFVPCQVPVHKAPTIASAFDRMAMLNLAVASEPNFHVDDREIQRGTPSYMIETLQSFRTQFGPEQPLALILGSDVLNDFTTWRNWEQIFDLAHLIIVPRGVSSYRMSSELQAILSFRKNKTPKTIVHSPAGEVFLQRVTKFDISSTLIRSKIAKKQNPRYLIPEQVLGYIRERGIYGI